MYAPPREEAFFFWPPTLFSPAPPPPHSFGQSRSSWRGGGAPTPPPPGRANRRLPPAPPLPEDHPAAVAADAGPRGALPCQGLHPPRPGGGPPGMVPNRECGVLFSRMLNRKGGGECTLCILCILQFFAACFFFTAFSFQFQFFSAFADPSSGNCLWLLICLLSIF